MALNIRREDDSEVKNPRPTHAKLYINRSGVAKLRLPGGVVRGVGSLPTLNWKNGVPGNPYVAGDTINAQHNTIVMVQCEDPGIVTIQLPDITPDSAAMRVGYRNMIDKKKDSPGVVVLSPGAGDAVESQATGQDVAAFEEEFSQHVDLESDGVGRWNMPYLGGGSLIMQEYPGDEPV